MLEVREGSGLLGSSVCGWGMLKARGREKRRIVVLSSHSPAAVTPVNIIVVVAPLFVAGGEFDDVKFLRSAIGTFKQWREEGDKKGQEVIEIEAGENVVHELGELLASLVKKRRGEGWEDRLNELGRVVEKVEADFAEWKKRFVEGGGESGRKNERNAWKKREAKIRKVFRSWIHKEEERG